MIIQARPAGLGCSCGGGGCSCNQGVGAVSVGSGPDILTGAQQWLTPTAIPSNLGNLLSSGNLLLIAGFLAVPYLVYSMFIKKGR